GYKEAATLAAEVRKALELRDRVLADLPYYAQWLTRRPLEKVSDASLQRVERLAEATRQLVGLLRPNAETNPKREALGKLCQDVNSDFRALAEEKDVLADSLINAGVRVL